MTEEEFYLLLNISKHLEEEIAAFLDYVVQESCNEAEEDISSAVIKHMLSGPKEDIFKRLPKSLKEDILKEKGYPCQIPHPWWGTRKLRSFLLEFAAAQQQTLIFLIEILSVDYVYRIKNPINIIYIDKKAFKYFLSNHHPNVVIKLVEKETLGNISSEDIYPSMLEVYDKLLTNHPHVLKHIRVRSVFQYYKALKKTLRDVTPEVKFPVNLSLLEELQTLFEGEFEIKSPSNSIELLEWGEILLNCLGDYSQAIQEEETYIIGFFQESELLYVAQILKSFEVNQFKGIKNVDAPKHLQIKLKDYLKKK